MHTDGGSETPNVHPQTTNVPLKHVYRHPLTRMQSQGGGEGNVQEAGIQRVLSTAYEAHPYEEGSHPPKAGTVALPTRRCLDCRLGSQGPALTLILDFYLAYMVLVRATL